MKPQLLVKVDREGYVEKLHYGFILVVDENFNIVLKQGDDDNEPFPFRSAAKPLQATPVIDSGAFEHFGFTHKELAIMCASHVGDDEHVETVKSILKKIGLSEENLHCVPHTLQNNCSGKHSGMLAACVKNGWDINTYLDKDHPLQKQIMAKVKELCALENLPPTVVDGCTAPVPVLPHYNMAVGYLNLFLNPKYEDIKLAMTQNPYIVGGEGKIDTEVMKASPGKLVAKVAAAGSCVVMNLEEKKVLVVKITDADRDARTIAVWDMVRKLGWVK
ncbi:MAG: hypothetical protein A2Y25_10210 [Candidatus Melainabacteria bacterium GWF2_37_15]|nr:MAG: hypothetical protein A2Y25_10210 [Candidatus Melainabacteria bacterium GWF2_37_15]